jgi:farnesyl-diphosphate farnesyltransferase
MRPEDLGGPLLRSVSRSFYLTIRVLPASLRAPIGLAYLLARTSDTIADSADVPPAERRQHLAAFKAMVDGGTRDPLALIQARILSAHAGETVLISQIGRALDWLDSLDGLDREQIRAVLAKIIHGQDLDLARFADPQELTALKSGEELEEYTYLVAGCVGEFWTDVCLHHLPRYSRLPADDLRRLGAEYGKALQFVNILRDLPADLAAGRCYLPVGAESAQRWKTDPKLAREAFLHWLHRAETLLESGRRYIASLHPARLRVACYLPWQLGRQTLGLLAKQPPLETRERVKATRADVRRALFSSAIVAFSNRPLVGRV